MEAAKKQSQFKANFLGAAPALPLVRPDIWLRNEDFVYGLTVSAESAKMAQKLTFGNLPEGGQKKAKFL